ncbi:MULTISPECIES: metallophosphoesterase [Emticicia]|uniref:metallophosphoesterase n=1 Tax=Emticicia TaxID=312278 RepID=UPI0007D89906|nr:MULTISPECIES: metallophosphoesterase [Emticicia]
MLHLKKIKVAFFSILIVQCCCFQNGKLYAQNLTRGPYLQQLSSNGVIIRWRTDIQSNSIINFSTAESSSTFSQKIEESTQEHIVQLTNLQPNTKYFYSVVSGAKTLASGKDFYFITAPTAGNTRPINIWAMGDFGDDSKEVYIKNQNAVREQYLKNKSNYTDLWLWLGDNAYCCGTDIEYQRQIFDFYGSSILGNTVFFPSPGNHEYYETSTGQVDKKINYFNVISVPTKAEMGGVASNTKEYYSFNYSNIHFISLDSYGLDEGKYRLSDARSKQYQWLISDLEANKGKSLWTIVFFHHPPYTKRSHDSNAEPDLVAIRESLVPIFDKYKVDLVLNGHSHSYERSYLMKGHTGHSMTFDVNIHAVQNVNGKYENVVGSKPIINKDEGTIYCVVGSAGRLDWNGDPNPHPSSVYSNVTIGGSLLFTINENRLDAKWVAADGVIRDNFTVFKNVNRNVKLAVDYGEKVRLNTSWKGSGNWSNKILNQPFIEFVPKKDTIISVVDSLGFMKDVFQINVSPQPIISVELAENTKVCIKNTLTVPFSVKNTSLDKWTYQLELSDLNGNFNKRLVLAKSSKSPFQITLPDTLKEGSNYRFRVRPNVDFFAEVSSKSFSVSTPASISFTGNKTLPFDTLVNLNLRFTGTPPFTYKISSLPENTTQLKEVSIKVKPKAGGIYTIEQVGNICGAGMILADNSLTIMSPLATEDENQPISVFPNPTLGEIFIKNHTSKPIKGNLYIQNIEGKSVFMKQVLFNESEKIDIHELPAGFYILKIKATGLTITKKIIKH